MSNHKKEIDEAFDTWGINNKGHSKGGSVGSIAGPNYVKPITSGRPNSPKIGNVKAAAGSNNKLTRSDLNRIVNNTPEVMVKISKCSKDKRAIKGYLKYISRNEDLLLEDNDGILYQSKKDHKALVEEWDMSSGIDLVEKNGTKREAMNLILSMPPGTPADGLRVAASEFAKSEFPNNPYVFVAHNDEEHPHVHMVIRMVDNDEKRLDPKKADLQNWRKSFAEKLRNEGIEASATPRRARGQVLKPDPRVAKIIDTEYVNGRKHNNIKRESLSKQTTSSYKQAISEVYEGAEPHVNPYKDKVETCRENIMKEYARLYVTLSEGDEIDKKLAGKIVKFVTNLPNTNTRQQNLAERLKERKIAKELKQKESLSQKIDIEENSTIKPKPYRGPKLG